MVFAILRSEFATRDARRRITPLKPNPEHGRLLASLLYRTAPTDPWVLTGVAICTAITGLIACLLPLRRALNVDPVTALRVE